MKYIIQIVHEIEVEAENLSEAVQMIDRKEILIDKDDRKLLVVVENPHE